MLQNNIKVHGYPSEHCWINSEDMKVACHPSTAYTRPVPQSSTSEQEGDLWGSHQLPPHITAHLHLWCKPNTAHASTNTTVKNGGGNMLWGYSRDGASVRTDWRMYGAKYILQENLLWFTKNLKLWREFQQNNDPKHKAKQRKSGLTKKRGMFYSGQVKVQISNRLRICGTVWKLDQKHHPTNLNNMEQICQQEWGNSLSKLVYTYPKKAAFFSFSSGMLMKVTLALKAW